MTAWKSGLAAACLVLLHCSGPAANGPALPEQAQTEPAAGPGMVRLSEEAARRAGIEIASVEQAELPEELTVEGQVTLNQDRTVRVASFVEGTVTECCKSVGARVRKGEVLAALHSHQAHDGLAGYWKARENLQARQAELAYAEQAHRRASKLYELKAGSLQQVQEAETALSQAESARDAAEVALQAAEAHLRYLGIEVASLEKDGESGPGAKERGPVEAVIHVRAPIGGTVVSRTVTPGEVVKPSGELYRISDLSKVWVIAHAPERQLPLLREGMDVEVHVRAFPGKAFKGRVDYIAGELDPETRTVRVRCVVPNPGGVLRAAMYATIVLRSRDASKVIVAPDRAVQSLDGERIVFVPRGERSFEVRRVELGRAVNNSVEIKAGLRAGEQLVVRGAFALKSELLKEEFEEE